MHQDGFYQANSGGDIALNLTPPRFMARLMKTDAKFNTAVLGCCAWPVNFSAVLWTKF